MYSCVATSSNKKVSPLAEFSMKANEISDSDNDDVDEDINDDVFGSPPRSGFLFLLHHLLVSLSLSPPPPFPPLSSFMFTISLSHYVGLSMV